MPCATTESFPRDTLQSQLYETLLVVSAPPAAAVRCKCDDGYAGYDCSARVCPTGDDPGSWGQNSEVQRIT